VAWAVFLVMHRNRLPAGLRDVAGDLRPAPQIRLEFLERSGSFSHIEEPGTVFALVREFTG
jgi:hypothetical protein